MKPVKFSLVFLSTLFLATCNVKDHQLSLSVNAKEGTIAIDQKLHVEIKNPKGLTLEQIQYFLDDQAIGPSLEIKNKKLGEHTLKAVFSLGGNEETLTKKITFLNSATPKIIGYNILNEYPHNIRSYTQGLEFHNGILYEGTGKRGESKLLQTDFKTGNHLKTVDLDKKYFGEGITILNQKIYQLTWQSRVGFVYDLDTFERQKTFRFNQSKEGWGLCNDGQKLYKSDGTERIWILDPNTLEELESIQVYTNKGKITNLNELEWIDGKIYANRYQKNGVAIINPNNGAVEAVIDCSDLHKKVSQHPSLDVLNGIAYNPDSKTLFVTGKYWDKLFEIELVE